MERLIEGCKHRSQKETQWDTDDVHQDDVVNCRKNLGVVDGRSRAVDPDVVEH
jgi:hypothetical protein